MCFCSFLKSWFTITIRRGRDKHAEKKKLVPCEILKQFIRENGLKTAEDAQNLVKDLFADTIQELLEAEMDHNLGPSTRIPYHS